MLAKILLFLLFASFIYSVFNGSLQDFDGILTQSAGDTVSFIISICGAICFFCGLSQIASEAGITDFISRIFSPVLKRIMPSAFKDSQNAKSVTLNISSNMFGLGNAATPFGISATKGIFAVDKKISRSLAVFLLLNISSLQIIPSTVIALRQSAGSKNPSAVIPAVFITQILTCLVAVVLAFAFFREKQK